MITLIIARHGETIENGLNICQGQTHGTLSETGIKENELLGIALQKFSFSIIYSSPLARALHTAGTIRQYNPHSTIITDGRLMERHLGVLQGKKYPSPYLESDLYEGMETVESMADRMKLFLSHVKQKHPGETIVIVSHGYLIKVLLSLLNNLPPDDFHKVKLMNNSGFIEVILE